MPDGFKICTKCQQEKAVTGFYVHGVPARAGKLFAACKECMRAQSRHARLDHPELCEKRCASWRQRHPDQVRAFARANYHRHAESRVAKVREYQQIKRAEVRAWKKKYAHSERGRLVHRLKEGKRRAVKRANGFPSPVPAWVVDRLLAVFERKCVWCGGPFEHIDHLFPLAKYGAAAHRADNLVPSCGSCNARKHDAEPETWAAQCGVSFETVLDKTRQVGDN